MTKNSCFKCHRPVTTTAHFAHSTYPRGTVMCASCFKDQCIADLTGLEVQTTAKTAPESYDIATATRTRLTEQGAQVTTDWSAGVVWTLGDLEPPAYLVPFITAGWPPDAREEVGDDD
jgi:hypothetical protein